MMSGMYGGPTDRMNRSMNAFPPEDITENIDYFVCDHIYLIYIACTHISSIYRDKQVKTFVAIKYFLI